MSQVSRPGRSLVVRAPGLLTTVQDLGRWGWQHLGVPVGGAMDVTACRRANRVVGNDAEAAVLECTIAGPVLVATGALTLAVTGATFDVTIAGRRVAQDVTLTVDAGDEISIGMRRRGARVYVAVGGGIDVTPVLGSRATTLGVFGGRALRAGDVLPVGPTRRPGRPHRSALPRASHGTEGEGSAAADVTASRPVRVLPGPEADRLHGVLDALCSTDWTIAADSNRMAYGLDGARVPMPSLSLPSAGTVMGMLQVPPDGRPLLLMADRQTTGGYPVPAVVIDADLPRVAQLAPGDACRFAVCDRAEAIAARLALEREWLRR